MGELTFYYSFSFILASVHQGVELIHLVNYGFLLKWQIRHILFTLIS